MLKTINRAEPSTGTPTPMPRHLVRIAKGAEDQALCGASWDRLHVSSIGSLCEPCGDAFMKRHGHRHPEDKRL